MKQLTERVWFAPGGVNIGVIVGDGGDAILIDTGLNDTAVRKALRWVRDDLRGNIVAIVTTHGHADHFGGNAFVVKRTGARVYAPAWDEAILRYPLMQAVNLFAGADPPRSMRTPFLVAEASPVDEIYGAGEIEIAGVSMNVVSLAGHSPNQMGLVVDGVFFCADVVLPDAALQKYRMPYLYSLTDHLLSLDRALTVEHDRVVPGHGPDAEHVSTAVEQNRNVALLVIEMVLDACRDPNSPEDILRFVLEGIGAEVNDPPSYYLLHPTVFAFLSHLERAGVLEHVIERGQSRWRRL